MCVRACVRVYTGITVTVTMKTKQRKLVMHKKLVTVITFVKEIMFLLAFVCLFIS